MISIYTNDGFRVVADVNIHGLAARCNAVKEFILNPINQLPNGTYKGMIVNISRLILQDVIRYCYGKNIKGDLNNLQVL